MRVSRALDVRQWTCPACGVRHDRDSTAAKTMRAVGRTVNASGEAVRPGRARPHPARPGEGGSPPLEPWGGVNCARLLREPESEGKSHQNGGLFGHNKAPVGPPPEIAT